MILSHIVAVSENSIIGSQNSLPWDIPGDMHFFKETTKNHIIIMGRKTFESIGRTLPKRLNIIVTRQKDYHVENGIVVTSVEEALEVSRQHLAEWGEEVFICGGGEIYKQTLPQTQRIYFTRVHKEIEGDTSYPEIDLENFEEVKKVSHDDKIPFTITTFQRRIS